MNPATDVGKKDLPEGIRSRFTEVYVHSPDQDIADLLMIIDSYIGRYALADEWVGNDQPKAALQRAHAHPHATVRAGHRGDLRAPPVAVRGLLYVVLDAAGRRVGGQAAAADREAHDPAAEKRALRAGAGACRPVQRHAAVRAVQALLDAARPARAGAAAALHHDAVCGEEPDEPCARVERPVPCAGPGPDLGGQDLHDQLSGEDHGAHVCAHQQPRAHRLAGVLGHVRVGRHGQACFPRGRAGGRAAQGPLDCAGRAQPRADRRARGAQQTARRQQRAVYPGNPGGGEAAPGLYAVCHAEPAGAVRGQKSAVQGFPQPVFGAAL
ncbi:hypothetical protein KL932_004077 [Ogataea haglerorum]|nr:hypothetical protein KL932_004077 [Ogataea haglerorum]